MAGELAVRDNNLIPGMIHKDPDTGLPKNWEGRVGISSHLVELPVSIMDAEAATFNAAGDNTVKTPASGKALRLYYISLSADGANTADVTVTIKLGAAIKYKLSMKAGAIWARSLISGRKYLQGAINEALVANLSAAQSVHVSIETAEI